LSHRRQPGGILIRRRSIVLCSLLISIPALAQQQDPEDDKRLGVWLDQGISVGLSPYRSLEFEAHERFDNEATQLYDYFFQGGMAFRLLPWLTVLPMYRYERYPLDSTTSYENRLLVDVSINTARVTWRPNLRIRTEGRFPGNRVASARVRLRPGIDFRVPLRISRPPVVGISNEFFIVPGVNSFSSGGSFNQNRFQAGVRLFISDSVSIRPYFLLQSVNRPTGWESNGVIGVSVGLKAGRVK
jgi:hypothetical protein